MSKSDHGRRLLYFLSIEDAIRSPLIRSQTLPLLREVARSEAWRPRLASLYPALNWWLFRDQRRRLGIALASEGVALDMLPIAFLTRHFHIPARLLPWYKMQVGMAVRHLARLQPQLIHARSYPAALAGRYLKQRTGAPLLFDARSLYVEEGAVVAEGGKGVMFGPEDVAVWKQEEARLMAAADAITVVSQPMADILAAQYPQAASKLQVVPIATPVPTLETLRHWRAETRQKLGIAPGARLITYVGSWFEPELTLPVIERLLKIRPQMDWELLLLVAHAPTDLQARLNGRLGRTLPIHHLHLPHEQVFPHLAAADLAVLPQADPAHSSQPSYKLRARSVLSIKFTEYLACGLPVLVSRGWAGAAADIVAENDLGLVYDEASDEALDAWLQRWQGESDDFRQRAWSYARRTFDRQVVFEQYRRLYAQLVSAND